MSIEHIFTSEVQVSDITTDITGTETATLTASDYSETDNGDGTYTYTAQYSNSTEGEFTFTISSASTSNNTSVTWGQQSTTIDTSGGVPSSGIARYEFEQTLTDSWNNNDLTGTGGITYTTDNKKGTYAGLLDGVDDYATVPFNFDSSENFSVVGWVYFVSFIGDYQPVFTQRDNFSNMDWQIVLDTSNSSSDGWSLGFGESLGALYNNKSVSAGDTTTGVWNHIGLTKGGDTWTFYTDGSEQFQITDSTGWTTDQNLYIGTWQAGDILSNIRIDQNEWFTKELTATEVNNHFNTGSING